MSNDNTIKKIKYLLKGLFYTKIKCYDKAIYNYQKSIKYNLSPYKKRINYNELIEKSADLILKNENLNTVDVSNYPKKILILNSEIYDTGGHTELALRYAEVFHDKYPIYFYITNVFKRNDDEIAPEKSKIIRELVSEFYISSKEVNLDKKIIELYNYIIEKKITTINVNMHMNDVVSCACLYLIRKFTNINVIFWNHADHFYSIGIDYCDKISTRCKNGKSITPYLIDNNKVINLPFLMAEKDYIAHENIREKLNIPKDAFVTLTGCGMGKLGDSYFNLIKKILDGNKNIYHILVTNHKPKKIKKLQKKYNLNLERFIFQSFTPYFDDYIKSSNLYIDSFPQGSALTLVDCIKYSIPVAVKINKKFPTKSFEEYLYPNYELASETEDGLYNIALRISTDLNFYNSMKNKVYNHFKMTYSLERTLPKYEELIK